MNSVFANVSYNISSHGELRSQGHDLKQPWFVVNTVHTFNKILKLINNYIIIDFLNVMTILNTSGLVYWVNLCTIVTVSHVSIVMMTIQWSK